MSQVERTNDSVLLNPTAVIGDNVPDWAAEESARLAREYAGLENDATVLLAEARKLPERVDDEETANEFTVVISRFKDLDDKVEGLRVAEGLPLLRKTGSVNSFFFRIRDRLLRRKKTDPAGGADVLSARLHDYNERRLAAEQLKRDEVARVAREAEDKARREREELERLQREAADKAARARNTERIAELKAESDRLAAAAAIAADAEQLAHGDAAEATASANAKPADKVRERHAGGATNTMARVGFAEITDEMQLDPAVLWAFVKTDAKLAALNSWAKITQHRQQMKGAIVGFRNETQVRR
jgi:hypothetical protein